VSFLPGKTTLAKTRPPHINPSFTPQAAPSAATIHGPKDIGPEDYAAYKVIILDSAKLFPGVTDTFFTTTIEESGDHLYVAEITGPDFWYARVGPHTNPWIRLKPGMVIQREFRSLAFGMSKTNVGTLAFNTTLILYSSRGTFIETYPMNRYGARWPTIFAQSVTNSPVPIGGVLANHFTVGKDGGFMMLFNNDLVNTIYITFDQLGAVGQTVNGMPLLPGQTRVIPLDGPMGLGQLATNGAAWQVTVPSGTAELRVILSSGERDLLDPNQNKPVSMS